MIGFEYKSLAIIFSILMLAEAYSIRKAVGTYILPAALFSLAWFLYTFIPLVVLYDVPINPFSILYILLCVTAFSLSALPFKWRYAFETNKSKKLIYYPKFNSRFIKHCLYLSVILSFVLSTISMISNGVEMKYMFLNLIEASGKYAALRGNEQLEYGLLGVLSIFFTYITPIFGAFITYAQKSSIKRTYFLFISFAPSLYYMLTQSAKLTILISIILFLASLFLMKIYSDKLTLFKFTYTFKLILFSFLLIPLVSISFLSREGYSEYNNLREVLNILVYSFNSYAFGQIYAFSDFFSFYLGMDSIFIYKDDFYSFGYYTFKSIFDLLGGTKQFPPGFFNEGFTFKDVFATNIYTIFRSLIYDFGGIGSILFMYLFGLFVHAFYYRLLVLKNSWVAGSVFIVSIVFLLMSYLFSIFTARYIFLLGVALFIILKINSHLTRIQQRGDINYKNTQIK